ncbi:MAG: (d)CMP kinase [Planctomycetota bacterium]
MIITIDGPAGAGKSSVARRLAQELGFWFLDTGAMYRAVALAVIRQGVDWSNTAAVAQLASQLPLAFDNDRVLLGKEDVTRAIRSAEVTTSTRHVADNQQARRQLVSLQRQLANGKDVVTEGRDQGTVAFPHADCKFFLTASPRRRAERRARERWSKGEHVTLQQVLDEQNRRDQEDESRPVGRLVPAGDAVVVDTDQFGLEQVVDRLLHHVRERFKTP